jgi:hypothetical protein
MLALPTFAVLDNIIKSQNGGFLFSTNMIQVGQSNIVSKLDKDSITFSASNQYPGTVGVLRVNNDVKVEGSNVLLQGTVINCSGAGVSNLANPTTGNMAATMDYVDTLSNSVMVIIAAGDLASSNWTVLVSGQVQNATLVSGSNLFALKSAFNDLTNLICVGDSASSNWTVLVSGQVQNATLASSSNLFVWRNGDSRTGIYDQLQKITIRDLTTNVIAFDSQNNFMKRHGVVSGTVAYVSGASAKIGKAASFTGNGIIRVDTPNNAPYSTQNRSVSFWMYVGAGNISASPFSIGPLLYGYPGYPLFMLVNAEGANEICMWYLGAGSHIAKVTDTYEAKWWHVAVTWSNDFVAIYTNGVLGANAPYGLGNAPQGPIWIGGMSGEGGLFKGTIDEFAVFNKVLTGTEITSLYNSGAGVQLGFGYAGLVAYYTFDNDAVFTEQSTRLNVQGESYFQSDITCDGLVAATNSVTPRWYVDNLTNGLSQEVQQWTNDVLVDTQTRIDTATNAIARHQWYELPLIGGANLDVSLGGGIYFSAELGFVGWSSTVRRRSGIYYDGITNVIVEFYVHVIGNVNNTTGIVTIGSLIPDECRTNIYVYNATPTNWMTIQRVECPVTAPWSFGIYNTSENINSGTANITGVRYYLEP